MLEKYINSYYPSSNSGILQLVDPAVLEKTAGVSNDILNFLHNLLPSQNKSYGLINALSAGDYWGSNMNGDWFDENELVKYHKTFEALGNIYELHNNKDPKIALGKVIFSFYHPDMHRVELIVEFDNDRAKKILDRLRSGETLATSMGTRVSYETCSICGNISKTLSQRCSHLKNEMNNIYPDGRKVYAKNFSPKFFDISIVRIGADKTSRVVRMIKVNSDEKDSSKKIIIFQKVLDSDLKNQYNKTASFETNAEIMKEIPVKVESAVDSASLKELTALIKKRIDADVLYKLSEFPFTESLSTMLALRIMPTPEDFQKLALLSFNQKEDAEELERDGIVFDLSSPKEVFILDGVSLDNASQKIALLLENEIPFQSNLELWDLSRKLEKISSYREDGTWYQDTPSGDDRSLISKVFTSKPDEPNISPVKNPIVPLGILGSLYYGYSKLFKTTSESGFKSFLDKYPWLLPIIIGGAALTTVGAQNLMFEKQANFGTRTLKSGLIGFPTAFYLSGNAEAKARSGQEISSTENFLRKNPTLTGILMTMAGNKVQKILQRKGILAAEKANNIVKIANILLHTPEQVLKNIKKDLMEVI